MKKIIIVLMAIGIMFGTGFRGNAWGTKEADIVEKETSIDGMYSTRINGAYLQFAYYFDNNKLYQGIYMADPIPHLISFMIDSLSEKYGKPSYEDNKDANYNKYLTTQENYEFGNISRIVEWKVNGTTITLYAYDKLLISYVLDSVQNRLNEEKEKQDKSLL